MSDNEAIPTEEVNGADVTNEVETPVEPQIPVEPEDNAERTQLGRKVKYVVEEMGSVKQTLDEMKEMLARSQSTPSPSNYVYGQSDDDDEIITKKEAMRLFEDREREKEKNATQYTNNYSLTLSQLARQKGLDEAEYKEIEDELVANHYGINKTGNAANDAMMQFNAAEAAVLRKKLSLGSKVNLNGGKPNAPLGAPAETKIASTNSGIKLDDEIIGLLKEIGRDPSNPDNVAWAQKIISKGK